MDSHEIFLIYARAANGTIGFENRLPWHIPADFRRFKAMTMGKPMVMGRKTFESLPGVLPGRRHIVLTRHHEWSTEGAEVVHSVEEALELAREGNDTGEIAVVGGSAIYDVFRPLAERIEVTEVHAEYQGDVFMKPLGDEWVETRREDHEAEGDKPAFSFVTYTRAEDAD
jgi:dihydrofolate reductase